MDLEAFRSNLRVARRCVGPRCKLFAVVKADAYGHGLLPVARAALREERVLGLAVATPEEAMTLRETAGFENATILLMAPSFGGDAEALQRARIDIAVGTLALLRHHLEVAQGLGSPPRIHLKIDTGMGRSGLNPTEVEDALELVARQPQALAGLMTHFSVSDSLDADDLQYTQEQAKVFTEVADRFRRAGHRAIRHAANSGAILHHPQTAFDAARPGIMLYGSHPDPDKGDRTGDLRQVMTLTTKLAAIHERPAGHSIGYGRAHQMPADGRVGLLPIGYGDGFPRNYNKAGGAEVLLRGRRVPILGRICMDQTLIDLSGVPETAIGDDVVIYGTQGVETISIEDVARRVGTIPYEITCQLGARVPRCFVNEGNPAYG